jgi:hypothetical protein
MKPLSWYKMGVLVVSLFLLLLPIVAAGQTDQPKTGPAPIGQQLVREGDLAVKLVFTLGLSSTDDENEAENQLAQVGIIPRNGWIADYPVTPDIIGELQQAVGNAADAEKLSMTRDEAVQRFDNATAELKLAIKPHNVTKTYETLPENAEAYPNPTVINNYYNTEGPPVVTYYAPPPDYYYLYSWVPYPFWWTGFWFPGFFVLNDFHRTIVIDRRVHFVSNHFNDVRAHRVFRIDPVRRFRGSTFAGIGVTDRRGFIATGVPRSDRTIFNGSTRRSTPPGVRTFAPRTPTGGRSITPAVRGNVQRSIPAGGSGMRSAPSRGTVVTRSAPAGGNTGRMQRR